VRSRGADSSERGCADVTVMSGSGPWEGWRGTYNIYAWYGYTPDFCGGDSPCKWSSVGVAAVSKA
jgi:hypothetical protein